MLLTKKSNENEVIKYLDSEIKKYISELATMNKIDDEKIKNSSIILKNLVEIKEIVKSSNINPTNKTDLFDVCRNLKRYSLLSPLPEIDLKNFEKGTIKYDLIENLSIDQRIKEILKEIATPFIFSQISKSIVPIKANRLDKRSTKYKNIIKNKENIFDDLIYIELDNDIYELNIRI